MCFAVLYAYMVINTCCRQLHFFILKGKCHNFQHYFTSGRIAGVLRMRGSDQLSNVFAACL